MAGFYPFLACFWLGVALLLWLSPEVVGGPGQSRWLCVFAGVMCFYNLTRWRLQRLRSRARPEDDEPLPRRHRRTQSIDPTFDLSRDDPASDEGRPRP